MNDAFLSGGDAGGDTDDVKDGVALPAGLGVEGVALGALATLVVALVVWLWPGAPAAGWLIFVALLFAIVVLWPLCNYLLSVVICDDKGLTVGRLWRRKRVLYSEIEGLLLLTPPGQLEDAGSPCILVKGRLIWLGVADAVRPQLLRRIERGVGGARRFEKRDRVFDSSRLALPVTFDYQRLPLSRHQKHVFACVVAISWGIIATALLVWFFRSNVVPMLFFAALWSVVLLRNSIRSRRQRQKQDDSFREQDDERIVADEKGLTFTSADSQMSLKWARITRLERDCDDNGKRQIYRVEGEGDGQEGVIEFRGFYALTELLRERCDLEWEETQRFQRITHGVTRDGEALTVSADREGARLQLAYCVFVWICAALISLAWASFGAIITLPQMGELLLWCTLPPLGIPLYLALATQFAARRIKTICDANGLTHRGWLRAQTLSWPEVEAYGAGETCDWVRARDGRVIRIAQWPVLGGNAGRRVLRAEITRRAPDADGDWKSRCDSRA